MRTFTHLEFRADYAKSETPDFDPSGEEVISFLVKGIRQSGIEASDPVQEDWGWCTRLKIDGFGILMGCGDYLEYEDGWLCFVEPPKLSLRRLFKPDDALAAVRVAANAMQRAVVENPRCTDRKWWTDKDGVGETVDC